MLSQCRWLFLEGDWTQAWAYWTQEDIERSLSDPYYISCWDWMSPYRHPRVSQSDYALILSGHDCSVGPGLQPAVWGTIWDWLWKAALCISMAYLFWLDTDDSLMLCGGMWWCSANRWEVMQTSIDVQFNPAWQDLFAIFWQQTPGFESDNLKKCTAVKIVRLQCAY